MPRFAAFLLSCPLLLPALPALAQTVDRPGRGPGYGPMWDGAPMMWGRGGGIGGWESHPAMAVLCAFVMLLALIGIVALILWLVRASGPGRFHHRHGGCGGHGRAQGILAERFARGEIDKTEYEERRRLIGG